MLDNAIPIPYPFVFVNDIDLKIIPNNIFHYEEPGQKFKCRIKGHYDCFMTAGGNSEMTHWLNSYHCYHLN